MRALGIAAGAFLAGVLAAVWLYEGGQALPADAPRGSAAVDDTAALAQRVADLERAVARAHSAPLPLVVPATGAGAPAESAAAAQAGDASSATASREARRQGRFLSESTSTRAAARERDLRTLLEGNGGDVSELECRERSCRAVVNYEGGGVFADSPLADYLLAHYRGTTETFSDPTTMGPGRAVLYLEAE